jgi:hypothetical protein
MTTRAGAKKKVQFKSRSYDRFSQLRYLHVVYEGRTEVIPVRPPDISPMGMFINTPTKLPQGSVLKLHFRLSRTGFDVSTRAEVRFCLPGVGIGVEFMGLTTKQARALEEELDS